MLLIDGSCAILIVIVVIVVVVVHQHKSLDTRHSGVTPTIKQDRPSCPTPSTTTKRVLGVYFVCVLGTCGCVSKPNEERFCFGFLSTVLNVFCFSFFCDIPTESRTPSI
jgi:hypothetical protein